MDSFFTVISLSILDPVGTLKSSSLPHIPQLPKCVAEYAEYLKNKYIRRSVFPDGDWPPSIGRQYTELSLIERDEKLPTAEEATEMEEYFIHGKVKQIIDTKKDNVIKLPDILSLSNSKSKGQIKVLMDGTPGIGKTTVTRKMCHDWASGKLLQQYHFLVLLEFRNKNILKAESVDDLLPADDVELRQQVAQYIKKTSGQYVLFIFDAFDELDDEERIQKSIISDIIKGEMLHNCSVLITSRPYASGYLQSLNCISHHVEVIGFTEEQIKSCILQNVSNHEEAKGLVLKLEDHLDIMSLCYTPLHCAIMLYVYKQEKCTLPNTLTNLFEVFILNALKRHVRKRNDHRLLKRLRTLNELPNSIEPQFNELCKLAYDSFLENKLVFSYEDLESTFPHCVLETELESNLLGLMTAFKSFTSTSEEIDYQFLHLSIQEFLAAKWATMTLSDHEQAIFIKDHLKDTRYRTVLKFLAGISRLVSPISDVIFPKPQALSMLLNTENCLLPPDHSVCTDSDVTTEVQPSQVLESKPSRVFQEEQLFADTYISSPICYAASQFAIFSQGSTKVTHPCTVSHFRSSKVTPIPVLAATKNPRVKYQGNIMFGKFILLAQLIHESQNFDIYPSLLHVLDNQEKLSFRFYRLMPADCIVLAHFLARVEHQWKVLEFHFCGLTDQSLEIFQKMSSEYCSKVRISELRFCYNAASLITRLALLPKTALFSNTKSVSIEGLQYPDGIPDKQIELYKILEMKCLTNIRISIHSVPDHHLNDYISIFTQFTDAIQSSKTLKSLFYEHPHTSNCSVFECTAAALKENTSLHLVSIFKIQMGHPCNFSFTNQDWTNVCPTIALHLFQLHCRKGIKHTQFLHRMLLKSCQVCSVSRESAFQSLIGHSTSSELDLSHCGLSDENAEHIGFGLAESKSVERLNIRENNISAEGIMILLNSLKCDSTVTYIDICNQLENLKCGIETMRHVTSGSVTLAIGFKIAFSIPHVGEAVIRVVAQNIIHVHLQITGIIDAESCVPFFKALNQTNSVLLKVTVNRWKLGSFTNWTVAIFSLLECNSSVKELDISENQLNLESDNQKAGCAIERMLTANRTLKVLKLYMCDLNDILTKFITAGLCHNASLAELDISYNKEIPSERWVQLFKVLCQNSSLKKLNIGWNKLGVVETDALAEMLTCNKSLIELNIHSCYYCHCSILSGYTVREAELQVLARGLLHNTALQRLVTFWKEVKEFLQVKIRNLQKAESLVL